MLKGHGYDVISERRGSRALELGRENPGAIDLSLVDWNYGGTRGGLALATGLREDSPEMATLFFATRDRRLVLIPDPEGDVPPEDFTPAAFLSHVLYLTNPAYYDYRE